MQFETIFDSPSNYSKPNAFHVKGGAPFLLDSLIKEIHYERSEIEEVNLAWYLFNNAILHEALKQLALEGVKVNVITIPREGYDPRSPKPLYNSKTDSYSKKRNSKYSLATPIFSELYHSKDLFNYSLFFFPHLYIRSPYTKQFARGRLPYSLHTKTALIRRKTMNSVILSSSNLAVRDQVKHECMQIVRGDEEIESITNQFFQDLKSNSIEIKEYSGKYNTSKNRYAYIDSPNSDRCFYSAPFYFDSPLQMEEVLINALNSASERIIICGQHLAAYDYEFKSKYHSKKGENLRCAGILTSALEKAKSGLKVTFLSQTYVPPKGRSFPIDWKFRKPMNELQFRKFSEAVEQCPNTEYFVNERLHMKYIIVDNNVFISTYNYTPTQFIYLDDVDIKSFREAPELSYDGIFCEVSNHIMVESDEVLSAFLTRTEELKNLTDTFKVYPESDNGS